MQEPHPRTTSASIRLGVALAAATSALLLGAWAPGDATAAKRGKLVVHLVDRGEARVLCPLDARQPDRVSANLARSRVGRCVRVNRKRVVLLGLKPTRVVVRSYGPLGAGPCFSLRRAVKAPCRAIRIASGKTKRIRWKVPRMVTAKTRAGTLEAEARAVIRVTGDPAKGQTVVLRAASESPRVGAPIVVPVSARARDGVLGIVTDVRRVGKTLVVSTKPAALDDVYRDLKVQMSSPVGLLQGQPGKASAAQRRVGPFTCSTAGFQPQKINVTVDLRPLNADFDLNVRDRYIYFLLAGTPKIDVDAAIQAKASCAMDRLPQVGFFVPGTPIHISFGPAVEISTETGLNANFKWRPRVMIGFHKGRGHNQDFKLLNPRDASFEIGAGASGNLFLGAKLEITAGGRIGLQGQAGPEIAATSRRTANQICRSATASMKLALNAIADVFITRWTFPIGSGNFGARPLFEDCATQAPSYDAGGGPPGGGGSGAGESGPGEPQATTSLSVGASASHVCVIRLDDSTICWGFNFYGQASPPTGSFDGIGAGVSHSCGLRTAGLITCWGYDYHGQASPPAGSFKAMSVGWDVTCAIRTDNSIVCWGNDVNGQASPPMGSFKTISAGAGHSCAIRTDESIACWGYNLYGQASSPTGSFNVVSAGGSLTCALRTDNSIHCWGSLGAGQAPPSTGSFKTISAGWDHACAIRMDNSIACWGSNSYGQASPPTGSFKAISAGAMHSCAIRTDDSIACWGSNDHGQTTPPGE